MTCSRRAWLSAAALSALGMGRYPVAGRLSLALPWSVARLDPHDPNDPAAAFFGSAVAQPIFGVDSHGRAYPTLAAALPEQSGAGCTVRLRAGLRSSSGRRLDARDLAWSVSRARRLGAFALLWRYRPPVSVRDDALAVHFPDAPARELAALLSSPSCALLPRSFSPEAPDGTGAFAAQLSPNTLVLTRNLHAPRGPAYLDQVVVASVDDLATPLRRFESGEVDVGWLGRGLHAPRPGSRLLDAGLAGWVVLHSGKDAGAWGAPGAAAGLLANIAPGQLERFGLGRTPPSVARHAYGGPACKLLVPRESAYMMSLGRTLSELLSRPGHEISLEPLPSQQLRKRKLSRDFGFALDLVRPLGEEPRLAQLSLLQEAGHALSQRPPALESGISEDLLLQRVTATLSLAVVGRSKIVVAAMPDVHDLERWVLGDVWRATERTH